MRLPQFSLRTLLVGFCLAAVVFYWGSVQYRRANNQRYVVSQLAALGATVTYDWQVDDNTGNQTGPTTWLPDFVRDALGPDYFQNVRAVDFRNAYKAEPEKSEIRDIAMLCAALQSLPQLKSLDFNYCLLDAEGYAEFLKLQQLEELTFSYGHAANVGLSSIAQLRNLRKLSLGIHFRPEPDGLTKLAGLDLEELDLHQSFRDLEDVPVYTYGYGACDLSALAKMPRLKKLTLTGINLSKTNFELLLQLPQLEELELNVIDQLKIDFRLPAVPRQLKTLRIMDCLVTGDELRRLAQLSGLQELELRNLDRDPQPLTRDAVLACAKDFPHLKLIVNFHLVTPDGKFVRVKR